MNSDILKAKEIIDSGYIDRYEFVKNNCPKLIERLEYLESELLKEGIELKESKEKVRKNLINSEAWSLNIEQLLEWDGVQEMPLLDGKGKQVSIDGSKQIACKEITINDYKSEIRALYTAMQVAKIKNILDDVLYEGILI